MLFFFFSCFSQGTTEVTEVPTSGCSEHMAPPIITKDDVARYSGKVVAKVNHQLGRGDLCQSTIIHNPEKVSADFEARLQENEGNDEENFPNMNWPDHNSPTFDTDEWRTISGNTVTPTYLDFFLNCS